MARTHKASKTRMPHGRVVCSKAAPHKASKVMIKVMDSRVVDSRVMDSKAQEVVMARQASRADTTVANRVVMEVDSRVMINRVKELEVLGSRPVQDSMATFR